MDAKIKRAINQHVRGWRPVFGTRSVRLSDNFSLEPAFVFAKRGFERKDGSFIGWGKDFKANTSYIEMPIDVVFNATIGR
jgi:hypothetical protein